MRRGAIFLFATAIVYMASCSGEPGEKDAGAEKNSNGRNDAWGFEGYGGGGAMFHPEVSPHDPNYAYVACDMTGSYVTYDGGETWRMFNLRGPVDYFVFDPLDSNTVYANAIGLFKSTDRGNTWSIFYPQPGNIAGIVSKGDHASEVIVTLDSTRRKVHAFAVDPENSRQLFAVILIDGNLGFFTSDNAGTDWTKEKDLQEDAQNIFISLTAPADDRTILITGKTGVTKREHGEWETHRGPDNVSQLTEFAGGFDQNRNQFILYAISGKSYFNSAGDASGIYYSEDGGETWENREQALVNLGITGSGTVEWRSLATSAFHPQVLYVSYNNLQTHADTTCLGVARSNDFGKTWELAWKDQLTPKGNIVSPNYESGWINERFGPTWGENPFSLAVSPHDPDVCYGTDFGRTTRTIDGGKTWQQVYTRKGNPNGGWVSRGLEVTTSYGVVFDPYDENHVFIANTDVGLMESSDGGESWSSATLNNGIPRTWINSTYWLTFDTQVKGRAWAAMSGTHDLPRPKMFRRNGTSGFKGGVLMTEDAGKSWTPVSADIGEAAMTHILVDQDSDTQLRTLYACAFGKGVYKSTDGGKTWEQKNQGLEGDEPFAWRIERRRGDGVLFLIVCRRSEDGSIGTPGDGALYMSDDGAASWKKLSLPVGTNGPMSIVADPDEGSRLLLSAWGRRTDGKFSADTGGGIFLSDNNGASWKPVLSQDQHIHDITYDPRSNVYYACGFNGAAYQSADRGEHWERIPGYNFKWGKRVDPDPRDPGKVFIITFGGGVWYGPAAGDTNAVEDIVPPIPYLNGIR